MKLRARSVNQTLLAAVVILGLVSCTLASGAAATQPSTGQQLAQVPGDTAEPDAEPPTPAPDSATPAQQQPAPEPQPPPQTSAYVQAVLADSPVAYWRLNETTGSAAADTSGNSHTASIIGGVTRGVVGALTTDAETAMRFDGRTGYVRDNTEVAVGPDLTIEAWVKADALTEDAPVVSLVSSRGSRILYLQGEQFRGMDDVTSNWPKYSVFSATSVDATGWHHVALTIQAGANLTLYVDGAQAGSASVPVSDAFSANVVLGWSDDPGFKKFAGSLAEVAVYSTVLSADHITAHFQAGGGIPATSGATCTGTLQSAIDAAPYGSVLKVPPCVYRETIAITKPLTLDGQGKAELRGSDVWTSWTPTGSRWISTTTLPNLGNDSPGAEYTDPFRGSHLEQAFVDGAPLTQVVSNPNSTQFTLDGSRHVILGANPAGHVVEVTTRNAWASTQADNVTITNFTFRHAASTAQGHAIGNDDRANFVLSNSTLTDAHGTMLSLGGGDQHPSILDNTLSRAGDLAIGSNQSGHALIRGNTIADSGWGGYDWQWQGGGMKFTAATDLVVDGNAVYGNGGPGIWCDIRCSTVTLSNNKVHDNAGSGVFFEISTGAKISSNTVWSHSSQGILISDSAAAEVWGNTLAWNTTGISILATQRSDRSDSANVRHYVHDNVVIMNKLNGRALEWLQSGPGKLFDTAAENRGENNRYWYPADEEGNVRFAWQRAFQKLSDFADTPGGKGSQYLPQPDRDRALTSAGAPLAP